MNHRSVRWLLWIAAIVVVLAIALTILATRVSLILHARVIKVLEDRFQSKVTMDRFSVTMFPRVTVIGEGLTFQHHGRTDVPPLITIRRFTVHTGLTALLASPMHVGYVRLDGLKLTIPLKDRSSEAEQAGAIKTNTPTNTNAGSAILVIDRLDADGTLVDILPRTEGKEALHFEIRSLALHSVGKDRPMHFVATLTNPKPPGTIQTAGQFGPWQNDDPGSTPVEGHYTFSHADLSVFKGIAGMLSSSGDYKGALQRIDVTGQTDVPDFVVRTSGNPVHLTTQFHAIVNGTDGDTYLQPVTAHYLHTTFVCRGKVEGTPGIPGKTVALDVDMRQARIEDLLRLAVKGTQPAMTGAVQLQTKFALPPGGDDIMQRLHLSGRFAISDGRFRAESVQQKVAELSRRGQGLVKESPAQPQDVASNFAGTLTLDHATASFSNLVFAVPGAQVQLAGNYGIQSEALNFHGDLRLQAKLSQLTTGWKSVLLKAVDPFFEKGGAGAVIPIRIGGTREHPAFGLELGRR